MSTGLGMETDKIVIERTCQRTDFQYSTIWPAINPWRFTQFFHRRSVTGYILSTNFKETRKVAAMHNISVRHNVFLILYLFNDTIKMIQSINFDSET